MSLTQRIKDGNVPRQYRFSMPFDSRFDIIPGSSILSEAKEIICRLDRRYSLELNLPLGSFGLPYAGQFGFGNAVHRLTDIHDHIIWALTIPNTTLYRDDPEMFEKNLLCVSATLQVVFSALNMSREDISEDGDQFLFIEGVTTKPGVKDFSFSVLLLRGFFDWLAVQEENTLRELEKVILGVINTIHERLTGFPIAIYHSMELRSGSQYISLPSPGGDSNLSLHPDGPEIDRESGCKVLYYSLHSIIEQLTFLAGIAALCDFVISHATQKEESK